MKKNKNLSGLIVGLLVLAVLGYVALDQVFFAPKGKAELSWIAPTEDERGEPLANLAGFQIHCWNRTEGYTKTFEIHDPTMTSFVVDGLEPGDYECAISALDEDGDESPLSNVKGKSIE